MIAPADYTGYALYREAMDTFGDPVFARWICRGYPWGGVDLNRAHEGFLLARDGVTMTGGDARTILNLLIREVTTLEHRIGHEGQAAILGPAARALRRLMTDIRRLASAHPAHAEFRLRCPCSAGDGEFSGGHDNPLPQAGTPAALTLRSAARQIAGARNAPAAFDRNEALDGALGLVNLALHQLGSAEGEATSAEGRAGMTTSEGEQSSLRPVYLSGVLTVEAELSVGRLYDGSTHAENASRVVVALVCIGGAAMLFTEDESGQLTRLRIPGPGFLRLADDAEGKLARSRQQPDSRPGERGGDQ